MVLSAKPGEDPGSLARVAEFRSPARPFRPLGEKRPVPPATPASRGFGGKPLQQSKRA